MKTVTLMFLIALCYVECRKTYTPIDKNANVAFINMEGGGGVRPGAKPAVAPAPAPVQTPAPKPAVQPAVQTPTKPVQPPSPTTAKSVVAPPAKPIQQQLPTQIKPVPVNPQPAKNPITTPGPGSVKQLINYYDSQGKASPIRPYSYSQAVKQG